MSGAEEVQFIAIKNTEFQLNLNINTTSSATTVEYTPTTYPSHTPQLRAHPDQRYFNFIKRSLFFWLTGLTP